MFGVGAPTARQIIVASLPSKTVTFCGGCSMIGVDANFFCFCLGGRKKGCLFKIKRNLCNFVAKENPSHKKNVQVKMGLVLNIR